MAASFDICRTLVNLSAGALNISVQLSSRQSFMRSYLVDPGSRMKLISSHSPPSTPDTKNLWAIDCTRTMDASSPNSRIRFGKFEVDLHSGELRKQGHKIRIQPQPLKVLAVLLERPGELVTREELRKRLWPGELYVDFEHGLNRSINKLRRALLDDASSPLYIETISTRGYRFIYSIDISPAPDAQPPTSEVRPPEPQGSKPRDTKHSIALSVSFVVLLATIALGMWRSQHTSAHTVIANRPFKLIPLVTFANGSQMLPAFSPDGSRVAYAWASSDGWYLEVKDVDSDTHLRLTHRPGDFPPGPAWSPDGRQIAFARAGESPEERGIYVISSIGGPERKLRSLSLWHVPQRVVSWSPDGRWIAFADEVRNEQSAGGGRGPNAIYLISPETLETRQLTYPPAGDFGDSAPAFSPDGASIAFVRTRADSHDEIYTMPILGGTLRRIVTDGLWTNGLAWSADGSTIVYDRSLAGGFKIWRVSSTGDKSQPLDIPYKGETFLEPTVWHDRVAFEAHDLIVTTAQIALRRPQANSPESPIASTRIEQAGRYSPDGRHIAFISDRTGASELWVANSDGANPIQLTHLATPLIDVSWHPAGNAIAVSAFSGKVHVVSLDTHTARLVYQGAPFTDETVPNIAYSRDGNSLYILSQPGTGETYNLLKMPSSGGRAQKVIDGRLSNFAESLDGSTLYYSLGDKLYKRPVVGGADQYVAAVSGLWDIQRGGIYLLGNSSTIELYSLNGKHLQTVAKLGHFRVTFPLSISPDEQSALLGYEQRRTVEIDMVQGFN